MRGVANYLPDVDFKFVADMATWSRVHLTKSVVTFRWHQSRQVSPSGLRNVHRLAFLLLPH